MRRRSKTPSLILIFLAIVVVGGIGFYFYKSKNENPVSGLKPRVEFAISRIEHITDNSMDMSLKLLVHNPLPVGLTAKNFRYTVDLDGVRIIESDYAERLEVKSNDSTVVTLPTQINIKKLAGVSKAKGEAGADSADYHLTAALNLEKPFLGKDTLHFDIDKRLPLIRLPKVEMEDFDMEKFRLSKSELVIGLRLTNPNAFPIEFKDASYVFDLGKQEGLAKGVMKGVTKVKAKSTEIYEIPVQVDMGKTLKTAGQLVVKGKSLPFKMHFKCKIASENEMMKNSEMDMIMEGELKDLEKMKKSIDQ